jgi:hypothetical protein
VKAAAGLTGRQYLFHNQPACKGYLMIWTSMALSG